VKPKLLVAELWGLGDLVIATPFLQAASERYAVTVLAKPYARDLQTRFWPKVRVVPFVAPWTAFTQKYRLLNWPWEEILRLRRQLAAERFDFGLSARWDPRDHFLLWVGRVKTRLGFPRMGSQLFLSKPLTRPDPAAHRYEHWRVMATALGFELPARESLALANHCADGEVLVHTGAGQPVRVWPLDRFRQLVARLRSEKYRVRVACDPDQRDWWLEAGEAAVLTPRTVTELFALIDRAGVFIGNDSGPGHLAAFCGVPTFTLFGAQLPEWFAPLHPRSEWLEGKACPYKPCSDYCRFRVPLCLWNVSEEEAFMHIERFIKRHLPHHEAVESQTGPC
jgi:ADP-heptose:LPS heptosyltransferase